jgi:transposase
VDTKDRVISRQKEVHVTKRKRREYTKEFKADAVRLVMQGGKSAFRVAKDLDITPSALRNWINQAEIDAGKGPEGALNTAEREELKKLRRENKQLTMEREILKKATAFFAKESS